MSLVVLRPVICRWLVWLVAPAWYSAVFASENISDSWLLTHEEIISNENGLRMTSTASIGVTAFSVDELSQKSNLAQQIRQLIDRGYAELLERRHSQGLADDLPLELKITVHSESEAGREILAVLDMRQKGDERVTRMSPYEQVRRKLAQSVGDADGIRVKAEERMKRYGLAIALMSGLTAGGVGSMTLLITSQPLETVVAGALAAGALSFELMRVRERLDRLMANNPSKWNSNQVHADERTGLFLSAYRGWRTAASLSKRIVYALFAKLHKVDRRRAEAVWEGGIYAAYQLGYFEVLTTVIGLASGRLSMATSMVDYYSWLGELGIKAGALALSAGVWQKAFRQDASAALEKIHVEWYYDQSREQALAEAARITGRSHLKNYVMRTVFTLTAMLFAIDSADSSGWVVLATAGLTGKMYSSLRHGRLSELAEEWLPATRAALDALTHPVQTSARTCKSWFQAKPVEDG